MSWCEADVFSQHGHKDRHLLGVAPVCTEQISDKTVDTCQVGEETLTTSIVVQDHHQCVHEPRPNATTSVGKVTCCTVPKAQ